MGYVLVHTHTHTHAYFFVLNNRQRFVWFACLQQRVGLWVVMYDAAFGVIRVCAVARSQKKKNALHFNVGSTVVVVGCFLM